MIESLETRKLELEERRLEAEVEARRAELEEKRAQRELQAKKEESDAELKRLELNATSGRGLRFTGAQATVAAAAVALFSGAIGGAIQAWSSRAVEASKSEALVQIERLKADANIKLEAQKQEASEKLDRAKFETTLILKAIESPVREEQIRNLKFFLNAGFIRDPEGKIAAIGVEDYPSLPPPGGPSLLVPVASVSAASPVRALARPIGLLEGGMAFCTGWLVDQSHVVTAVHCLDSTLTDIDFRLGYISKDHRGDAYKILRVDERKKIGNNPFMGYAILTVEPEAGKKYGALGLFTRVPKVGEKLLIVHHAEGNEQKFTTGECVVVETTPAAVSLGGRDLIFEYHCESAAGGSGAPVIATSDDAVLGIVVAGKGQVDGFGLLIDAIVTNSPILQNVRVQASRHGTR
jgi:hypothetical protein